MLMPGCFKLAVNGLLEGKLLGSESLFENLVPCLAQNWVTHLERLMDWSMGHYSAANWVHYFLFQLPDSQPRSADPPGL